MTVDPVTATRPCMSRTFAPRMTAARPAYRGSEARVLATPSAAKTNRRLTV